MASASAAVAIELDAGQLRQIDDAGKPEPGFPRDFLESMGVRELIYGKT